jgi:two-component system CheB/CheR fusion protein
MQPPHASFALRVLVVDDLRDSADSLALLLQLWGHRPAVAYTGESALEVATAFRPDVVLLDIGLPGIDGYEVAWRLRQLPGLARCRLMALTGNGEEDDVRRCKEAGIDCHFLKPMDLSILRGLLATPERLSRGQLQLATQTV